MRSRPKGKRPSFSANRDTEPDAALDRRTSKKGEKPSLIQARWTPPWANTHQASLAATLSLSLVHSGFGGRLERVLRTVARRVRDAEVLWLDPSSERSSPCSWRVWRRCKPEFRRAFLDQHFDVGLDRKHGVRATRPSFTTLLQARSHPPATRCLGTGQHSTATRLLDGRTLVVGGTSAPQIAEIANDRT